ncbi:hypothetical protein [Nonomuraea longicatena]|uniref:Uncharacterized protein n=1 Tax=Nonomuraea longicatena TaxID=83682 RepID=A0ABN1PA72_9ACTN
MKDGYSVRRQALRGESAAYGEKSRDVAAIRDTLRAAFEQDRRALGGDQYGAELEKKLPAIEEAIFNALRNHIADLEGVSTGLRVNESNYRQVDRL